jgi:hypothetical protein
MMQIEASGGGTRNGILGGIMSTKQTNLLLKVMMNLLGYFGIYFLAGHLDLYILASDQISNMIPAAIGIETAMVIKLYRNYVTRQKILKKEGIEDCASASLFSSAGLTTVFNAMTQTTTTLCANGQCFTIYSNTIASNMAAFGVSMTAINSYLVPLCCLLLGYSVWCLYRGKRSLTYKPFLLGLGGSLLIVLDNFILGERLKNLMNIPSWVGNGCLIGATIWAVRESSIEKNANPFRVV